MPQPPEPAPEALERKRAGQTSSSTRSLIWLLLLIAVLAALWYVYGRSEREPEALPVETVLPAPDSGEDGSEAEETPADEPAAPSVPQPTAAPSAPSLPDRPAQPTLQVQPAYPPAALRVRAEGTVLLRVEVDAQGRPTTVEIQRSSRSRDLDRAAREAVGQWTFQPAVENGQPVASTVTVPVDFRIGDR
ncbi:TonB family protein [Luteimonas sp. A478]